MFDLNEIVLPTPLDQLSRSDLSHMQLSRGDVLFTQNQATEGIYFLVDGVVSLTRVSETGHSVVLHRARSGQTFAEASLFAEHYHCTATAEQQSSVILFRLPALKKLFAESPEFSRAMAKRFAEQVQRGRRQIERLSIPDAEERILVALADGLLEDDIGEFAELIGLAPATVYRVLSRLAKSGRIEKLGRGRYQAVSK